jgi:prepilin-type N-terminal cleavage/methylation domain-containing protein
MRRVRRGQSGFSLIELLIVVIIIGILAVIAIPVYAAQRDQAKKTVLQKNSRDVDIAALTYVLSGLSTTYRRSDNGAAGEAANAATYVSNALEVGLEQGVPLENSEHYINPYSGKKSIVNWGSVITTQALYSTPAVFITNAGSCRYASFQSMSLAQRTSLRGTIVVCWNTLAAVNAIQIYFVRGDATKSPLLHSIPLG